MGAVDQALQRQADRFTALDPHQDLCWLYRVPINVPARRSSNLDDHDNRIAIPVALGRLTCEQWDAKILAEQHPKQLPPGTEVDL